MAAPEEITRQLNDEMETRQVSPEWRCFLHAYIAGEGIAITRSTTGGSPTADRPLITTPPGAEYLLVIRGVRTADNQEVVINLNLRSREMDVYARRDGVQELFSLVPGRTEFHRGNDNDIVTVNRDGSIGTVLPASTHISRADGSGLSISAVYGAPGHQFPMTREGTAEHRRLNIEYVGCRVAINAAPEHIQVAGLTPRAPSSGM